ncbi:MAG: PAS domain S-box protein [Promethearchaeota archaeon]
MAKAGSRQKKSSKQLILRDTKSNRYDAIIEAAAIPIVILNKQGCIQLFNAQFEEITGYEIEEIVGKPFFEVLIPTILQNDTIQAFKEIIEGKSSSNIGTEWITKNGEKKIIELQFIPTRDEKGLIHEVICTGIDITERKQAQETLLITNRALRVLTICNEILVRAIDESTLLQEVCQALIEVGGYRFAWVGYAEKDKVKTIRPVAYAGFENGYLKALNLTWDDKPQGRGPTGTAIRSGKIQISRNIITDPSFSLWRVEAITRGYVSFIALPLISSNQTIGSLNIYSASSNSFSPDEVALLEQLSNDLAFGILSLRADEELEKERDKAQIYLNMAGVMFVVLDASGRIILINQKGCEILGYNEAELLGKNWFDTCLPERFRKEVKSVFNQLIASEIEPVEYYENPVVTKNGLERLISWHNIVLRDEKGEIIGTLSSGEDVTEQKLAEEALRTSEERLRAFFEHAPVYCYMISPNGEILDVNDIALNTLGYKREELVGKPLKTIYAPEVIPRMKKLFAQWKETGKLTNEEMVIITKTGERRTVLLSAAIVKDKDGNVLQSMSVQRDITERKQMLERMQYLHSALQGIRNVNQLIVRERNRKKLLKKACNILVKTRSYHNAWIVLINENKSFGIVASAHIDDELLHILQEIKQGRLPFCTKKAYEAEGIHLLNIAESCTKCPVAKMFQDKCTLTTRLIHQDRIYGILNVSVPREMIGEEELSLFKEVAEDISYALYLLDIEEERVQAEKALQESEENTRNILHYLSTGVILIDAKTHKIISANPAAQEMIGAPMEKIAGKICHKFICPTEKGKCPITDKKQKIDNSERVLLTSKGDRLTILKTVMPLIMGNQEVLLESFVNISKLKNAEQALRTSETRYRRLFDGIPIGLYRTESNGKILDVNPAMVQILGAKDKEALFAANSAELFVEKELRGLETSLLQQDGVVRGFEARFRRLDGRIIWIRDSARIVTEPDGQQFYQGSLEDITDQKDAESNLREARHRAEFLVDLMGHDLTNINQGLMSSLELLLYNPDFPPHLREAIEMALAQVERSAQLIDNVKRFQSLESTSPKLGNRDVYLAITAAVEAARRSFPQKILKVKINQFKGEHNVLADGLLIEVFFNILHNAIKFDPKEKIIVDIQIGNSRKKGFLKIQIMDRGMGIPDEVKDKILTRFSTEHQGLYGWGIGLVLVQQIIDRYGGKIWVSDRVKGDHTQGSNFNIEIPRGIGNGNNSSS